MAHEEAPKQTVKVTSSVNLYSDVSGFYLNEIFSDIEIVLSDRKVPAHKIVLAARCKFFETLLLKDPKQSELRLQNVSSNVFVRVLEYIYTGAVTLLPSDEDLTFHIIHLSKEYSLTTLKTSIVDQLKSDISVTNVITLMKKAHLHELDELAEACLGFIDKNVAELLESDFFNSFPQMCLIKVLQRDAFPLSEIDVFRIVEKWCKVNKDLKGLVAGCIRTSLFTKEEILNVVGPSKLVDSFELLQVMAGIEDNSLMKRPRALPTFGQNLYKGTESLKKASHRIGDQKGIVIDLGTIRDYNYIQMELQDSCSYSYYIEMSIDLKSWTKIIDYSQYRCRAKQILHFHTQKARYIKIVGTFATPVRDFIVDSFEVFLNLDSKTVVRRLQNGIICPESNVVANELGARVIAGSDNEYLTDGTADIYYGHRIGDGKIVIQLGQPYILSSLKLLLQSSEYKYFIETSVDSIDWTLAVDMRSTYCTSWQFHRFSERPVVFIRITGTHSSDDYFRCCQIQCPISENMTLGMS